MHDEPKEKPTFEDIVRELGYDKMAFFCDMVRPDQHEEREEDANLPTAPCCHSWSIERPLLPYDVTLVSVEGLEGLVKKILQSLLLNKGFP